MFPPPVFFQGTPGKDGVPGQQGPRGEKVYTQMAVKV